MPRCLTSVNKCEQNQCQLTTPIKSSSKVTVAKNKCPIDGNRSEKYPNQPANGKWKIDRRKLYKKFDGMVGPASPIEACDAPAIVSKNFVGLPLSIMMPPLDCETNNRERTPSRNRKVNNTKCNQNKYNGRSWMAGKKRSGQSRNVDKFQSHQATKIGRHKSERPPATLKPKTLNDKDKRMENEQVIFYTKKCHSTPLNSKDKENSIEMRGDNDVHNNCGDGTTIPTGAIDGLRADSQPTNATTDKNGDVQLFGTQSLPLYKTQTIVPEHVRVDCDANRMNSIFRDRSIEETEAAHDLLSLSQSLPPLPAPCVVTILHPSVTNYTSPTAIFSTTKSQNELSTISHYNHFPPDRESIISETNQFYDSNRKSIENSVPLTPPTSESSSDADHNASFFSDPTNSSLAQPRSTVIQRKSIANTTDDAETNKSAQVFGLTIFDSVMINDGRTKRSASGEAEIIHVEDKRKASRYKCLQCGKQYATSSNLSRHKQTHRSLDSQSAKKCTTCGKAYVSMPALAMHLLTHKLTHSCDVCGKLFSRPWLLQGHLRSHTGEKPYGCAHCGKAFADRSNLRAHMQTHSINKQYECTKCGKSFALKSYLNKHLESSCLRDEFRKLYDENDDYDDDIMVDDPIDDGERYNAYGVQNDEEEDEDINIIT